MREVEEAVEFGFGVGYIQVAAGLEKSGGSIPVSSGAMYGWESWAHREVSVLGIH